MSIENRIISILCNNNNNFYFFSATFYKISLKLTLVVFNIYILVGTFYSLHEYSKKIYIIYKTNKIIQQFNNANFPIINRQIYNII